MYADDTEMYDSSSRENVNTLISNMQTCSCSVKDWTVQNKLQLNEGKTEVLLCSTSRSGLPSSVNIGQAEISFSRSARNLGVIFDDTLSMTEQVRTLCQSAYGEIRRISSIRKYLSTDATKTLVTSLVLSRVDYCNSLLAGLPMTLLGKIQKVMNNAARLIFRASPRQHTSPLLSDLHWLRIENRIKYKVCTLCFGIFTGSAPDYLSSLVTIYVPRRNLRSASDTRILDNSEIPKRVTQGERAFAFYAPVAWNSLPFHIRHAPTLPAFKSKLKTFLFSQQ